jgi:hypothetical protein
VPTTTTERSDSTSLGSSTPTPQQGTTQTSASHPKAQLLVSGAASIRLQGNELFVPLRCSASHCVGTAEVTVTVATRGARGRTSTRTEVLARKSFDLSRVSGLQVAMPLTAPARSLHVSPGTKLTLVYQLRGEKHQRTAVVHLTRPRSTVSDTRQKSLANRQPLPRAAR